MTTLSLKLEEELKKEAHLLADKAGVSLSSLVKMILKEAIRRGGFVIDTKPKIKYHTSLEAGDMNFESTEDAIKYLKELDKKDEIKGII